METLWRQYATPDELARVKELEQRRDACNGELAIIRQRCGARARAARRIDQ